MEGGGGGGRIYTFVRPVSGGREGRSAKGGELLLGTLVSTCRGCGRRRITGVRAEGDALMLMGVNVSRRRARKGCGATARRCTVDSQLQKERKKTDNPREGWEDGTPPPHSSQGFHGTPNSTGGLTRTWSTWSAVGSLTSRAGELRSARSEPDGRDRVLQRAALSISSLPALLTGCPREVVVRSGHAH